MSKSPAMPVVRFRESTLATVLDVKSEMVDYMVRAEVLCVSLTSIAFNFVLSTSVWHNNARFSGFHPRLPIARLLPSLRAKEYLKALFVRGMTSVLVIDIGIPVRTLNLTNSRCCRHFTRPILFRRVANLPDSRAVRETKSHLLDVVWMVNIPKERQMKRTAMTIKKDKWQRTTRKSWEES